MGSQSEWLKPALQSYWSKVATIFGAIDLTELGIREDFGVDILFGFTPDSGRMNHAAGRRTFDPKQKSLGLRPRVRRNM